MQYYLFKQQITPLPLSECLDLYFTPQHSLTRETVCMMMHIDEGILRDWCEAFNIKQIMEGETEKTIKEYLRHFSNWIKYQDTTKDPKSIFNVERNTKDSKGAGRGSAQSFFEAAAGFNRK